MACLLGVLLSSPALAIHEFPAASLGDIWFQVDHAGFQDPDGRAIQEFYFRITNNQLTFKDEDGLFVGRAFVKLEFQDENEDKVGEASRQFEFAVSTEEQSLSADHAQLLLLREQVDPRTRRVKIEIQDSNARKRGLLYAFTGKRKNGTTEALLTPPPFTEDCELCISDIQFAWSVEKESAGSAFAKNGLNVVPNAGRTFGLLQNIVSVYYEVYDNSEGEAAQAGLPYILEHQLIDPNGTLVQVSRDTVIIGDKTFGKFVRFDVQDLPSGEYAMKIEVRQFTTGREVTHSRHFGVVWGNESWATTEEDVLDQARVLFEEKEFDRFKDMSAADREVYLGQFWNKYDPTPDTRYNELRIEFDKRVAYANTHFSAFGRKGMVTDRGRIYVRFGAPDEVTREVMPTQDRQVSEMVDDLEDESIFAQNLAQADDVDVRPFEEWIYTTQGHPLFPDREFSTSVTGLRFIFIDETGTGHFVMRYKSDFINY